MNILVPAPSPCHAGPALVSQPKLGVVQPSSAFVERCVINEPPTARVVFDSSQRLWGSVAYRHARSLAAAAGDFEALTGYRDPRSRGRVRTAS